VTLGNSATEYTDATQLHDRTQDAYPSSNRPYVTATTNLHHRFYIYVRQDPGIVPFVDTGAAAIYRVLRRRCET